MIDVYIIENHIYTSKKDTLKLMLNNWLISINVV
jgi:hypothetical protein